MCKVKELIYMLGIIWSVIIVGIISRGFFDNLFERGEKLVFNVIPYRWFAFVIIEVGLKIY